MTRRLIIPVLLLTLLVENPAFSADYQKGLDAYKSGDYATALREFRPLAEQGNAGAQNNLGVMYQNGVGTGMPQDAGDRASNVSAIMEPVRARGVPLRDVFIDGIVFLISVDSQNGNHYLNAVRTIRETYGREVHIGGGLSNVSFGLPKRRLINDAFIYLALDAGIDSGIIDPIQTNLGSVFNLDTESEPVKLAMNMLLGRDDFCTDFIMAFRDGRLG